jgi:hypothetical protein
MKPEGIWGNDNGRRIDFDRDRVFPAYVFEMKGVIEMDKKMPNIYIAENLKTGEIIKGDSKLFKVKLGIDSVRIYTYAERNGIFNGEWKIDFLDEPFSAEGYNSLTQEDLEKWENGRKEFLQRIKRKAKSKGRFRKPQEVR